MNRKFDFIYKGWVIFLMIVSICIIRPLLSFGASPIIIDHTCTDICKIPESAINQAKSNLHIAYGHTSHGSQLTTGMTGLIDFANNGGLGLCLPEGIFEWNNGGTGGALDLHDGAMAGDCGYYPQWVNETRAYLDDPSHSDVNVIIWSWCGQVDDKYAAGTLYSEYLAPMSQLETEYQGVTFVYMTGHVDHWDDADNKAANQMVRDYSINNNKVLYDFADIESYDPDGTFYEFSHDNCDYYESAGGPQLGNWAIEWQDSHTEGVDWYTCPSAHSQPLNANRKAYAAWWLWAKLAGWNPNGAPVADFSGSPTTGAAPLAVSFTDSSTGEITGWSWTFGDGGTSTEQNPTHIYDAPGTYTVTLEVTGPGGSDTETKTDYLSVTASGYLITSDLWIKAVIRTVEKGPVEAVWKKGGEDITSRGDLVIWGHFYTNPSDVTWGSENNPDLFVKIWFDVSGRVDVNYFHVSVPDIEVFSCYPSDATEDLSGTTTVSRRYIRHYYEDGQGYSDENYEDGNPPSGYSPEGTPSGYSIINDLRIGSMINTVEKGLIDGIWRLGGQDTTARGDEVVWGHFYASPSDVTWGSQDNPDLFVKIWFDVSGRVDVNFFHVSVPDIEVYSDLPGDITYDQKGTTIMDNRYIRHEYWR